MSDITYKAFGPIKHNDKEYYLTLGSDKSIVLCDEEGNDIDDKILRWLVGLAAVQQKVFTELFFEQMKREFEQTHK